MRARHRLGERADQHELLGPDVRPLHQALAAARHLILDQVAPVLAAAIGGVTSCRPLLGR